MNILNRNVPYMSFWLRSSSLGEYSFGLWIRIQALQLVIICLNLGQEENTLAAFTKKYVPLPLKEKIPHRNREGGTHTFIPAG